MPGSNKPLSPQEYTQYNNERKRLNKAYATAQKTMKVRYKVLCSACDYNAENGKPIIYDCPRCQMRYWNNCSVRQVRSGEIVKKLQAINPTLEWVMGYYADGTKGYAWHRHEAKYERDLSTGKWVPKENK